MNPFTSHRAGIVFAIASFTLWAMGDTFMKLAGEAKLPFYQVVAFMGMFAALFMSMQGAAQGPIKNLWPKNPARQIPFALLSLSTNLFNAIALKHLPLTLFFVTVFTAPMIVAVLAAFFLREKLTWQKIAAVILGFVGVIIAINPFQDLAGADWIGYAAATASTVGFAINIVLLRVTTQTESVTSLAFFGGCLQTVVCLSLMGIFGTEHVSLYALLVLAGMGFFGVMGNVLNYLSLRYTTAANVAQFHYTQIITGALAGYLIWHDLPAWYTVLGAAIIIGSGLYIAAQAGEKQHLAENLATIEKI